MSLLEDIRKVDKQLRQLNRDFSLGNRIFETLLSVAGRIGQIDFSVRTSNLAYYQGTQGKLQNSRRIFWTNY